MSDIKLFQIEAKSVNELQASASDLEKPLQTLIERNLEALLGVRFLASEYSTGKTHGGRIDTLGLDENSCPVIIEYKRSAGETVINQGLFYMDWLMDHQADFKLLVTKVLGKSEAEKIDWMGPRLICIAGDFTKFDAHAVLQIGRDIDLLRYRRFGADLLLFERVNFATAKVGAVKPGKKGGKTSGDKPVSQAFAEMSPQQAELFASLEGYLMSLGDDVQRKDLKLYVVYKRIRNFVSVVVQKGKLIVYASVNPGHLVPLPEFARDVRKIGHWGTGNLELTITKTSDLDKAKPILKQAYEGQ